MKTICESCCDSPATLVACGRQGTVLCGTCDTPRYAPADVTFFFGTRECHAAVDGSPAATAEDGRAPFVAKDETRANASLTDRTSLFHRRTSISFLTRDSVQGERVAFVGGSENATPLPCDICQSAPAVALCHEDRAFLCRACDVSIHSANEHAAAHSRFLFTNVKLELAAVGASKKRKAAEMNDRDEKPRVSVSGDFAVPSFGYHQLEQRVPDARQHAENAAYDVVADGPNTDPFAAEFLHLDGGDGKAKNGHSGTLDDSEFFVSAFFDDAGAGADDFGVVPVF